MTEEQALDSKPFITSITLGGFQVFDEPTTIPLGHLTFLFGPNSAGKSAVEDGLSILSEALVDRYDFSWNPDFERHWRRVASNSESFAPFLTIGLTAIIKTDLAGALSDEIGIPLIEDAIFHGGHEIAVSYQLSLNPSYHPGLERIWHDCSYKLAVDGRDVLCIDESKKVGVNFAHPLLRSIRIPTDYRKLAKELPKCVTFEDEWTWIWSVFTKKDQYCIDRDKLIQGIGMGFDKPKPSHIKLLQFRPEIDWLLDIFDGINHIALGNSTIHPHLVPASRKIPSLKDLTHLCIEHVNAIPGVSIEKFNLLQDSDPIYRRLAQSCLHERIGDTPDHPGWMGKALMELVSRINRALSDNLFVERGYSITADILFLLDADELMSRDTPTPENFFLHPAIVQICLVDAEGRRYSFEEVGSGLGYVLPVLCSVCDPHKGPSYFGESISLIQQPELHLHPALQAALGDVFIESVDSNQQIIVETHSEHLLLRILKRIRQTSADCVPAQELRIKPEDVVVAYFDPSPDGKTTVRRIRISEDGEFLDRWPRGFFIERDGELFDE
jgi:hypothetical protein